MFDGMLITRFKNCVSGEEHSANIPSYFHSRVDKTKAKHQ